MICRTHGAVTYLVVLPLFSRGRSVVVSSLFVVWCFSFCCVSFSLLFFFDAHKPPSSYGTHVARWFGARNVLFFVVAARLFLVFASFLLLCCWSAHKSLAPRTRTLLGVLGQATFNFVAVATSPNSGAKFLWGFLRSEKSISPFFFLVVRLFLGFVFYSAAIARRFCLLWVWSLLQLESCVVLLVDRKELTGEDLVILLGIGPEAYIINVCFHLSPTGYEFLHLGSSS